MFRGMAIHPYTVATPQENLTADERRYMDMNSILSGIGLHSNSRILFKDGNKLFSLILM